MREKVKNFIEENIIALENEDYATAFEKWYNEYPTLDRNEDYYALKELFAIFSEAGIDLRKNSYPARVEILKGHIPEYFDDMSFENKDSVTVVGTLNSLDSFLGIDLLELKQIFKEVCDSLDMVPTSELKVRYKL